MESTNEIVQSDETTLLTSEYNDEAMLTSLSSINEIQSEINNGQTDTSTNPDDIEDEVKNLTQSLESSTVTTSTGEHGESDHFEGFDEEYLKSPLLNHNDKHVFILSTAGKPIYTRHGSEERLAGLCGVIQALVSFVEGKQDVLRCIKCSDTITVFLVKGPLILVAVSKTETETQLIVQLNYVFNQIVSVLTLTFINRVFEQRRNCDLRRFLTGAERLLDNLLHFMEADPAFMLDSVRCLPLPQNIRDSITNAITSSCSKIRDLVFAILIGDNQLITLVRMKKYKLHTNDLHLIFNLIRCSESFKTAECWTPICLPKFDSTGFLHAHVSYLSESCQTCLLLLTVQKDAFFTLSRAKQNITEKLARAHIMQAINESLQRSKELTTSQPLRHIATPEIRHFMYKSKLTSQLYTSDSVNLERISPSNKQTAYTNALVNTYSKVISILHCKTRPVKLYYLSNCKETILAWITLNFELYVKMDPLVEKYQVITSVEKILKWIEREETKLFIKNAATF